MAFHKSDTERFAPCLPPGIRWIARSADTRICDTHSLRRWQLHLVSSLTLLDHLLLLRIIANQWKKTSLKYLMTRADAMPNIQPKINKWYRFQIPRNVVLAS